MFNFFRYDSPVMVFLTKVANLIILNILWLLCSLPLVTLGASTVAMYTVTLQMVHNPDNDSVVKSFFAAFQKDFWKSTKLFLAVAGLGIVIGANILAAGTMTGLWRILAYIPPGILLLASGYVFPLFAQFDNTIWQTFKNACLLSISHFFRSILILLLNLLGPVLFLFFAYYFLKTLFFWIVIGVSLISFCNAQLLKRVFAKYMDMPENAHIDP